MNFRNFYSEIEDIQKRLKSKDNEPLYRELQYFIQSHPWRSPLIYGSLYISQVGSSTVLSFFARKTFEIIEKVCEQRIKNNNTLKKNQSVSKSEELKLSKKRLEQLLISITLIIYASERLDQRDAIDNVDQVIQKKLRNIGPRFIDKLPMDDYLNLLRHKFRQNEKAFKPLSIFFDNLVKHADLYDPRLFEQQTTKFKRYIELLIEEAGGMIEKPDRIFSYSDSLNAVLIFAESLFSTDKMKKSLSLSKYKWVFQRNKSFDDLRVFWVTCMTGLYAFAQSIDRFNALPQTSEKVQREATSIKTKEKEMPLTGEKKASQGKVKKPKKSFFRNLGINPILELVPALK
jgi:hypothetical protein